MTPRSSQKIRKAEVHLDSGSLGMEFFYEKTLPDFIQAATKLDWDWYETFSQFENVLEGSYKTAWRKVVKDHFSNESSIVDDGAGFYKAIRLFVCTILDVRCCETRNTSIWPRAGTIGSLAIC